MTTIDAGRNGNGPQRYRAHSEADRQFRPSAVSRGSPEGPYLAGLGKSLNRRLAELKDQRTAAAVRVTMSEIAADRAEDTASQRAAHHRGGNHSWLLRSLIIVAVVAEGVTAFVGMEAVVPSLVLAVGLATLAAMAGAGIACALANRRLSGLHVPAAARVLEGTFVGVLTVLRYASLQVQGVGMGAAAGGAALTALISALALLGIEEVLVETHTFSIFASRLRVSYRRWRHARAAARLGSAEASVEAAAEKMQQHFLGFLLKEAFPLDQAQRRAAAFRAALADSGG
jgi:hypothetical protein